MNVKYSMIAQHGTQKQVQCLLKVVLKADDFYLVLGRRDLRSAFIEKAVHQCSGGVSGRSGVGLQVATEVSVEFTGINWGGKRELRWITATPYRAVTRSRQVVLTHQHRKRDKIMLLKDAIYFMNMKNKHNIYLSIQQMFCQNYNTYSPSAFCHVCLIKLHLTAFTKFQNFNSSIGNPGASIICYICRSL